MFWITGGPGSGKGTQSLKIAERYGFQYISVGELLRKKIHSTSSNRKWSLIAKIITNGELAPQVLLCNLLLVCKTSMPVVNMWNLTVAFSSFVFLIQGNNNYRNKTETDANTWWRGHCHWWIPKRCGPGFVFWGPSKTVSLYFKWPASFLKLWDLKKKKMSQVFLFVCLFLLNSGLNTNKLVTMGWQKVIISLASA